MEKIKIGVSGNRGSFSEEAANYYCAKNGIKDYKLKYLINVASVLRALNKSEIAKGVFPIENSNGGIVYEAVYAMSDYNFKIENIFEIDIQHCLLAIKGIKTSEIKKIVSHPQALKQCRMYLKRKWSGAELQEYSDTASAAKDISAGVLSKDCAAIAPKICASLYGLDILEQGIQDLKFNFTTFITAIK
ncbi:prephenate dehydratase [Candidatus Parcubacteria bacterium]|nr:prephenate dehydratase [Candidatus Parcubacteria bacterium]